MQKVYVLLIASLFGLNLTTQAMAKKKNHHRKTNRMKDCIITLEVHRTDSPWQDFTRSHEEEKASKKIKTGKLNFSLEKIPHLSKYTIDHQDLLAIDRNRRLIILNEDFFHPLSRIDATSLGKSQKAFVGKIKKSLLMKLPLQKIALFFLESQIIQTYWHLEANLCLKNEKLTTSDYKAYFHGKHIYYTTKKNVDEYSFAILIDKKDGSIHLVSE